ncbi:MAG: hypothetical protein IPJ27_09475 [Candidatus Accumulibacter sp.]|uniref:Uncharacterized protein n=1 Tax=Candidatus Accumulibacter proximus TaxID=2954385 RepID=A0A935PZJ0_9PROT|nr:hypothetical protein [Candidatus Accumulibacter proximus]
MPSKFLELIQVRLAVAICPSTEMPRLVKEFSRGAIADSFKSKALATAFEELTDESIRGYKLAADNAVRELSCEATGQVLLHEIERLV